ncbi:PREDICTED: general odorant-binding protein 56h-like [Rhagoletis zephyria]|uniref:general odorant-binding protein 56h-like n=1 Tax=Rhagoletis zephyria TaxID=28612 RepID=UPI0008116A74|nr:PREDICTED: general odorant-binding protein 56h-like [Rhagoletis zephyria]
MKSFITIAFVLVSSVVVMCEPPNPQIRQYIDECNKEHNVSPKDFHEFNEGKLSSPSEDLKCAIHCFMVKQGSMDEAGTFKPDVAKTGMPNDDKFAAAVDACKDKTGSSACETAFRITQCVISHK